MGFIRAPRSKPFALVVNYGPPHSGGTPNTFPVYKGSQVIPRPNVQSQDVQIAKGAIANYMNLTLTTDAEVGVLLGEYRPRDHVRPVHLFKNIGFLCLNEFV